MFAELLAQPGVVEICELRSRFGFMAFHGGSLEEQTDTIATNAARWADASLYTVAQPERLQWHVPSRLVDPTASAKLRAFLGHVEVVVALHGYGRVDLRATLLLGGRNRSLACELAEKLRAALPRFTVVDDLEAIPAELRGLHAGNPVNRTRACGVQLELPPSARGLVDGVPDVSDAVAGALAGVAQAASAPAPTSVGLDLTP